MQSQMLVDGQLVDGQGCVCDIVNPATAQSAAVIGAADGALLKRAQAAAIRAFERYSDTPVKERAARLERMAKRLQRHATELAELESLNTGKPVGEALQHDVRLAIDAFRLCAQSLRSQGERGACEGNDGCTWLIRQVAKGPVVVSAKWNYPLISVAYDLAAALAAGCSVIVKPSPQAPLSSLRLVQVIHDLAPPGMVNTVFGLSNRQQQRLDQALGLYSTLGALAAAPDPVQRKAPAIVYADTDVQTLIDALYASTFVNAGQDSALPGNLLVERELYSAVLKSLADVAVCLRTGDPADPNTHLGPLISQAQQQAALDWLDRARQEAEVATGGFVDEPAGFFLRPTVIGNPGNHPAADATRVFGPVISVTPFDVGEDPVAMANVQCPAGAASVWTRDVHRAMAVSKRLRHRCTWINHHGNYWQASRHATLTGAAHLIAGYQHERHLVLSY